MTGSNCRHPACKAGALPAELIVHVVTRPGIEPGIPPWKGGVLTAWPTGQNGSSSRTRTYDRSVNSRLLYQLSYRGMYGAGNEIRTRDPRLGKAVLYRWAIPACTWCLRTESNCRHTDFQSVALPTELPRHEWRPRSDLNWRSSPWQGDMLTATPRGRVSTLVDYSYILTWATNIMQVLFSNF